MFRPYLRVLRLPGAVLAYGATLLGSLPISMLSLSLLLLIRSSSGSMTLAGAVSGALAVGNGCGLLLQGRLLDRYGQTVVLVVAGLSCGASLAGLTLAAANRGPSLLLIILAGVSGITIPAVITCMRILIPEMVSALEDRRSAYALLGTQFNVAMISGPMVVSGLVLLAGPGAAVLVAPGHHIRAPSQIAHQGLADPGHDHRDVGGIRCGIRRGIDVGCRPRRSTGS